VKISRDGKELRVCTRCKLIADVIVSFLVKKTDHVGRSPSTT
jgi:hypothetical protein